MMARLKPLETRECPFAREAEVERAPALGAARAGGAGQVHRVDRRRQAASSGVSRPARRQAARATSYANAARGCTARRQGASSPFSRVATAERRTHRGRIAVTNVEAGQDAGTAPDPGHQRCRRPAAARSRTSRRGRRPAASRRRHARGHQPAQGVLAGARTHQGRSVPLLRAGRAVHPAGARRPSARDEAVSQRHQRQAVLPAPRAGRCRRRARRTRSRPPMRGPS